MTTIYIDKPDKTITDIIKRAFPKYNGRKYQICPQDHITLHDVNWSGGTKSHYVFLRLHDSQILPVPDHMSPWNSNNPEGKTFPLSDGIICIEHSHFCGHDTGIRIYAHPDIITPFLPVSDSTISRDMEIVLVFTSSYKNTYAGRSNIRYQEAFRVSKITQVDWDTAKSQCMEKGYLSKNNAITPSGRNIVVDKQKYDYKPTTK